MTNPWTRGIPWFLTLFRMLSAPAIFFLAKSGAPPWIFAVLITAGFLSDVFDGILARRWGTDSSTLRTFDSVADVIFYLGILLAVWKTIPPLLAGSWGFLSAIIFLEASATALSFIRFGKNPANHSYSSKLWGVLLFIAAIELLVFHQGGLLLNMALYWGIFSEMENFAILSLLPKWYRDIPSLFHAYRLREETRKR